MRDKWSVRQWMTANPAIVAPDLCARTALIRMKLEQYRHLLVVEDDKLVGIVSDRDLRCPDIPGTVFAIDRLYRLDENHKVSDAMTREVQTISPEEHLETALKIFIERKFGALPVVDDSGRVIGILSTHDVMRGLAQALVEGAMYWQI